MAFLSLDEVLRVWNLRPELLSKLSQHMAEFERQTGKKTRIGDSGGVRSKAKQARIYADSLAQGFRAAPGGQSFHEFGAAYDLIIVGTGDGADKDKANPLYETLAKIGESLGLRAGLHFKSGKPDPYHFELSESLAVAREKWATLTRERLWRALGFGIGVASLYFAWRAYRRRATRS